MNVFRYRPGYRSVLTIVFFHSLCRAVSGPEGKGIDFQFTNQWVVPYNRTLLLKYQCHINTEICSSVSSVKYLYKYCFKGHDMARIVVEAAGVVLDEEHAAQAQPQCEVKQFLDGRFFGSAEAAWRLLGFDLHSRQPPVQRLAVHLPGQQSITFEEDQNLSDVLDRGPGTTTLTAWFAFAEAEQQQYQQQLSEARHLDPDAEVPMPEALTVTYQESPMVATWNHAKKQWSRRKNKRKFPTIGRIEYVSPSQPELYYLRVLLSQVKGATSFQDLLTTNKGTAQEVVHGSFKDACMARGLLERDDEWRDCMEEAKSCASPRQIRALFATILAFNSVANPLELWNAVRDAMAEDFLYELRRQLQDPERPYDDIIYGKALRAL